MGHTVCEVLRIEVILVSRIQNLVKKQLKRWVIIIQYVHVPS